MRVVIECAPANSPGILRIRGQLVMDAGVTQRMFDEPFNVVNGLGGVGMTDKFGIQITGRVGRIQRNAEVVLFKHIFQKLGFLEISTAASLSRRIELMSE